MSQVAFVLGRRPSAASILPAVVATMRAGGATVGVHVGSVPAAAGLVVLRDAGADVLDRVEAAGLRAVNPVAGIRLAADKAAAAGALAAAGLPVPATAVLDAWEDVLAVPGAPVVKPAAGTGGQGVLLGDLPAAPPYPGPFLVQSRVEGDGVDRKLYVVGNHVGAVLRPWPAVTAADKLGTPAQPDAQLRELALAAGDALGLELYGVDVVVGSGGPTIVDVNAFPGYKGVPGAAGRLAAHLLSEVAACA